jgi:4-amino-4-deoxy-L-arabinose transferase-like glycosyltransferase
MEVFIALFAVIVVGLIIGEIKWGILRKPYDPSKWSHKVISAIVILPCLVLSLLFYVFISSPIYNSVAYPLTEGVNHYNPYIQQFDAFQKGQLYIDYAVDEDLLTLENPYDPIQREGIYYLWDRALYDGHYYSYFGIAPIIFVYYPYYILTGELPSDALVGLIFLLLTTVFVPLIIFEWAKKRAKKTPFSLLCVASIATTLGTNVFLAARGVQPYYYIAILAGMAFLAIFLFLFIKGLFTVTKTRLIYLFGAGVAYGLLFLSRINMAILAGFIILPSLIFFVIKRIKEKSQYKFIVGDLIVLVIPVVATLVFTCWFNAARFSSPWDFGTNYQLTVSDVSQNTLRITDLGPAIYHYIIQNLEISNQYSYIGFTYNTLVNYGHFVYLDASMSIFATPLLLGLLLTPAIIFNGKHPLSRRIIFLLIIIGIIFVAWLNFSMGGLIFRYTLDLCLVGALAATIGLLLIFERILEGKHRWVSYCFGCLLAIFFLASSITSVQIALITNGNLMVIKDSVMAFLKAVLPFVNLST